MSMLSFYLDRTDDPEKKEVLRQQYKQASEECVIVCCGCGWRRHLTMAFRCLYCGLYFCVNCAEKHFGMTIQEWIEKKRVEKRREYEEKRKQSAQLESQPAPGAPGPDGLAPAVGQGQSPVCDGGHREPGI